MQTERRKTFLIHFSYYAVILLCAILVLKYALPPLAPFVAACVIAYLLKSPIRFLRETCRIPAKPAAILAVLLFYGAVGGLLSLAGIKSLSGLATLFRELAALQSLGLISTQNDRFLIADSEGLEQMIYQSAK